MRDFEYVAPASLATALEAQRRVALATVLLGPARRTARMLAESGSPAAAADPRLYAPAGLHLYAETCEAIALSIIAEVQAVAGHAQGGFLRDGSAGIHDCPAPPAAIAEIS